MGSSDEVSLSSRRRWALVALWLALPLLVLGYQIAAKQSADALAHVAFGWQWLRAASRLGSIYTLLLLELASFVAWMIVLGIIKLSAAFPLTAVSYLLVIGASWMMFREPSSVPQVTGSIAILVGVWLIGRTPEEEM